MNDFDRIAAQLEAKTASLPGVTKGAARAVAGDLHDHLTLNSPVADGEYAEAWRTFQTPDGAGVINDHPEADRLEYGFHGTDELGRTYREDGEPHVRPAVAAVKPTARVAEAVKDHLT